MTKPMPDEAEVALEYPDKLYIGTFEKSSRFDAHLDRTGISLSLYRSGTADTRKSIRMHFHYAFFAEILHELARTVARLPLADTAHRNALRDAAKALYGALENTDEGILFRLLQRILISQWTRRRSLSASSGAGRLS